MNDLSTAGINRIVALPLFLAHGVHTLQDIPEQLGIENSSRKTTIKHDNNTIEIIYAQPFGVDPVVGELAYLRAREALEENKNETI